MCIQFASSAATEVSRTLAQSICIRIPKNCVWPNEAVQALWLYHIYSVWCSANAYTRTYNIGLQLIKLRLLGTKCPHNNSFLFIKKWSIQKYHFVKWTGTGKRTLALNFSGHAVDFSHLQIDWMFYRNGYISSYDRHKQHVRCRAVVNIALSRSDVNEPEQYLTLWLRRYAHGEETVLHDVCRHCRSTSAVTCWRTSL